MAEPDFDDNAAPKTPRQQPRIGMWVPYPFPNASLLHDEPLETRSLGIADRQFLHRLPCPWDPGVGRVPSAGRVHRDLLRAGHSGGGSA